MQGGRALVGDEGLAGLLGGLLGLAEVQQPEAFPLRLRCRRAMSTALRGLQGVGQFTSFTLNGAQDVQGIALGAVITWFTVACRPGGRDRGLRRVGPPRS